MNHASAINYFSYFLFKLVSHEAHPLISVPCSSIQMECISQALKAMHTLF